MKSLSAVLVSSVLLACVASCSNTGGWTLRWSDEFDGCCLNQSKWRQELGMIRNHEAQLYSAQNVFLGNGTLIIEARHEKVPNPQYVPGSSQWPEDVQYAQYTSGSIFSAVEGTYGRFEIRAKLPRGNGTWPALWLLGADIESVGWPWCGEIDVMESLGNHAGHVSSSIHCEAYNWVRHNGITNSAAVPTADSEFHIYSLEWSPGAIDVFVDEQLLLHYVNDEGCNSQTWPFSNPFVFKINLAIGGGAGGFINASQYPTRYIVDYVRVYERTPPAPQPHCAVRNFFVMLSGTEAGGTPLSIEPVLDDPSVSHSLYSGFAKDMANLLSSSLFHVQTLAYIPYTPGKWLVLFVIGNVSETDIANGFAAGRKSADWLANVNAAIMNFIGRSIELSIVELPFKCDSCPMSFPHLAQPIQVPGSFIAANYDDGGPGRGYHDTTVWNAYGDAYRSGGDWVDIGMNSNISSFIVGYIVNGEWLRYTLAIQASANYEVTVSYSNGMKADGKFFIQFVHFDSNNATSEIEVTLPSTGDWNAFRSDRIQNVSLKSGLCYVRFFFANGNMALHSVAFNATGTHNGTQQPRKRLFLVEQWQLTAMIATGLGFVCGFVFYMLRRRVAATEYSKM